MATYFVDDGGSATSPFDTWAKAATSLSALDDAVALASGDIVYIGHDHVCQYTHAANRTITGPAAGPPVYIISVTQGSDPPAYQASTTNQIDTTEGAYTLTFDGAFAMYGLCMAAGSDFVLAADSNENIYSDSCTFKVAANAKISNSSGSWSVFNRCVIDLTEDGTTNRTGIVFQSGAAPELLELIDCEFVNLGYRTAQFHNPSAGCKFFLYGSDLSALPSMSNGITRNSSAAIVSFSNCKMPASWTPFPATDASQSGCTISFTNCSSSDSPSGLIYAPMRGIIVSSQTVYRSGGASFEGISCSWLCTTNATVVASEGAPAATAYIYGYIGSTGSKTFDLYITNDTADFTDAEVWLEVEYLGTAGGAKWERATDQRATITTTAAAQDDDTTSTWVGTGPSFTYKQKLSVTATVAEEGQYRARVCVGVASIASSRYFYIDPKVTVS